MNVLFLLLLGFSYPFLEPGSDSWVTAWMILVPIVLGLLASVVVIYTGWEPFE